MCICGCILEVAAIGAAAGYVAKKCFNKKNRECKCICHKDNKQDKQSNSTRKVKADKQDGKQQI